MASSKSSDSDDLLRRYAERRLPRLLGEGALAEFARPEFGAKSELALLTFASGRRVALRAFGRRGAFRRFAAALGFCQGRALPVPRLLACDGWLARWRYGRWFCVEEFVEGELFICGAKGAREIEAVVQAVAALHGETNDRWGRPGRLRKGGFRAHFHERTGRLLKAVGQSPQWAPAAATAAWAEWLRGRVAELEEPALFSLVHHHLAADDIMVAPDGSAATLLDNGALQFDCFVHDVEDLVSFLGRETSLTREELVALYLRYQTHLPPETDYEFVARPFRVEYELKRLRRLLRNKQAGKDVPDSAVAERVCALDELTGGR